MRKLVADVWECGTDCNCWYTRIREFSDEHLHPKPDKLVYREMLYAGQWMNDNPDKEEFDEVREDFKAACEHYGITIDLSSNSIWDWGGEATFNTEEVV